MRQVKGDNMEKSSINVAIEEKIRRVNGAMAQEGMPLDEVLIEKLYRCFAGDTTIAEERAKTLEKYCHVKVLERKKHVR